MGLTQEQKQRMEQKKAEALAARSKTKSVSSIPVSVSKTSSTVRPSSTSSQLSRQEQLERMAQKKAEALARIKSKSLISPSKTQNLASELSKVATEAAVTTAKENNPSSSSVICKPNVMTVLTSKHESPSKGLTEQQKQMLEAKRKAAKLMQQNKQVSNSSVSNKSSSSSFYSSSTSSTQSTQQSTSVSAGVVCNTSNFYSAPAKVLRGSCSLVTNTRFELIIGYQRQVIDTVKQCPSAQYNATKKIWTVHICDHDSLLQSLMKLKPDVEVTPLPHWIIQTFKKPRDLTPDLVNISNIEPHLYDSLMPFQKEGIKYGVSRSCRVLIADDMGLGKTVQALGLASYYEESWPVLIVCQSTLKYSWYHSILRWLPSSIIHTDVSVVTTGKDFIGDDKFTIISYELVSKKQRELLNKQYKFVILDESHCIKDGKSARSKAVEPLMKTTRYLVLLSGTPALSRPIELFSQISALDPKLFRYVSEFGNRYCDGKMKRIGAKEIPDFSGSSHEQELSLLLSERCMIRRLKTDVLQELPRKMRTAIILDPAGVDSKNAEMKQKKKENEQTQNGRERHNLIVQWFQTTAHAKLKAVRDYVKDLLANSCDGRKFLVFAHHKVMLSEIVSVMEESKVGFIFIDGSVASDVRKERVDMFQTQDSVRVAVLSITAANAGITLTAASLVVFAELFWNPGVLTQAEDRAHRIGQTDTVTIQYLVARDTADDVIWPLIQNKLNVLNKAGLSKDNFEESESRVMRDTRQATIEDCMNLERSRNNSSLSLDDDDADFEKLWNNIGEDEVFSSEPEAKRAKLS